MGLQEVGEPRRAQLSTPSFNFAVIRKEKEFSDLRAEWEALHACSLGTFPYTRHEWIAACWQRQRQQDHGSRLHIVTVREAGQLVAAVPLRSLPGILGLRLITWIESKTPFYSDVMREDSPRGLAAIQAVAPFLLSDWRIQRFKLERVAESAAAMPLVTALRSTSSATKLIGTLDLARFSNAEEFLAGQPRNMRIDYRTTLRDLTKLGTVESVRLTEPSELAKAVEWLFVTKSTRLRQDGQLHDWFADPQTEELFANAARDGLDSGYCRVYALRLNGRIIAVELVFCSDDTLFVSKSAIDPEFGRISVGTLIRFRVMMAALAEGFTTADFMYGEYAWKARMRTGTYTTCTHRAPGRVMSLFAKKTTSRLPA